MPKDYSYKGFNSKSHRTLAWSQRKFYLHSTRKNGIIQIALSSLPQSNSYQIYNSYFNHARSSIRNVRCWEYARWFRIPIIFHLKNTKTHWCRKDKKLGKTKPKYRSANWYATRSNCWLRTKQQQPLFGYFTKKWFKVMFNGDWTEQSPLEKPNGLSFLVLYGLDSRRIQSLAKLKRIQRYFGFSQKRHSQQFSAELCSKINGTYHKATVGRSLFLKDAQADYLWRDTKVLEVHPCLLRLF
jgi:hypothetical protein